MSAVSMTGAPARAFRPLLSHPRRLLVAVVMLAGVVGLIMLAPALGRLPHELRMIGHGNVNWLLAGLILEALSFGGQVVLFRAVYRGAGSSEIGYRASYEITLAGHAATRLLASAGTGGVALTVWALRRHGLAVKEIARRMIAFLVLMYSVYTVALVVGGIGLWTGALSGGGSPALTLVPAGMAAAVIALALATPAGAAPLARRLRGHTGSRRSAKVASKLASGAESIADGLRLAGAMARERRLGLIGAPLWWGFDLAVLWACFHAFGAPPTLGVILVAYFVGTLANTLPLPGGFGGVEGGMIGALVAFGVHPELAVAAVLAYRLFAFWLPTIPGAIAYLQLRRSLSALEQESRPSGAPSPSATPIPSVAPTPSAAGARA